MLPPSYRETSYRERLAAAYPFHPELVDILTNRWGSLSGFQRTRGALRTLAHTVKASPSASLKRAADPSRATSTSPTPASAPRCFASPGRATRRR